MTQAISGDKLFQILISLSVITHFSFPTRKNHFNVGHILRGIARILSSFLAQKILSEFIIQLEFGVNSHSTFLFITPTFLNLVSYL